MMGPTTLPPDLPVPVDDGRADHLAGLTLPSLPLPATDGSTVSLAEGGRTVLYVYPRTGEPGIDPSETWNAIPGARGCTPQSCSFRDHFVELQQLGVRRIFGMSTQTTPYQAEAVSRLHLPFPLLSDASLAFATAARLPTFQFEGQTLLARMTLVIDDGRVGRVFYPVFPPDRSAADVVAWLRQETGSGPAP